MPQYRISRWALLFALAIAPLTLNAQTADTVLVSNSLAKVTRAEYDAELLKLPGDLREGFANNPRRVYELLQRMLVQKSLAAQARNAGLDKRPDVKARLDLEVEKFLSAVEIEAVDAAAVAEFNANRISIHCDPRNERSKRVAERLGYQLEGRLRNKARTPDGGLRDTLVYSLVPGDPRIQR